jgi:predicted DNA binding protein
MGVVVEYLLSYEGLPLVGIADSTTGDIGLEIGQPNRNASPVLVLHVTDADASFEDALETSDAVGTYSVVDRRDGVRWYRVIPPRGHWERFREEFGDGFGQISRNSSIIEGIRVTSDGWVQRRRFADREEFADYRESWREAGGSVSVRRVTDTEAFEDPSETVTHPQREALRTAYEMGYFAVPRKASLADVADELDVSKTSVSERLRRGHARIVESYLYDG